MRVLVPAYCGRLWNVYDISRTESLVFGGICSPSADGGGAESVESYQSCVDVLGAGRFGKNEDLDGFLEPVNLFDLVFNFCVCWPPADAAGEFLLFHANISAC